MLLLINNTVFSVLPDKFSLLTETLYLQVDILTHGAIGKFYIRKVSTVLSALLFRLYSQLTHSFFPVSTAVQLQIISCFPVSNSQKSHNLKAGSWPIRKNIVLLFKFNNVPLLNSHVCLLKHSYQHQQIHDSILPF